MSGFLQERVDAIVKECSGVWAEYGITAWERRFLDDVGVYANPSSKQIAILEQIETKAFPPPLDYGEE